jgi:NADPH-dependent 2,4-dienoyl-CoA reductase/sulfur reductase-like enzyme
MLKNKIIIIGGNAAGCAAAAKAKRVNPKAEVIIFEKSNYISTGTCELPYVLSGEIPDYRSLVFFTPESFLHEKGVTVYSNTSIVSIDRRYKTVTCSKGNVFPYDSLIIATGSTANTLPESELYKNMFTLKNIDDISRIMDYVSNHASKTCLVIGAGYIGLEIAGSLVRRNCEVTLIEKQRRLLPSSDEEFSEIVHALCTANGLSIYTDCDFRLIGNGEKITAVKIGSRFIEIDFVITALGFDPNIALASASKIGLGTLGGIKVGSKLQTSDPNIFAAGDVIEYPLQQIRKSQLINLATLARLSGYVAGANAAGGNEYFIPVIRNASVKIFNKYIAQTGLTEAEIKDAHIPYATYTLSLPNKVTVMPGSSLGFSKIMVEKNSGKILGAGFFGDEEVSGYGDIIAMCIRKNILLHELDDMHFNYTPPLSPFVNPLSQLSKISRKK